MSIYPLLMACAGKFSIPIPDYSGPLNAVGFTVRSSAGVIIRPTSFTSNTSISNSSSTVYNTGYLNPDSAGGLFIGASSNVFTNTPPTETSYTSSGLGDAIWQSVTPASQVDNRLCVSTAITYGMGGQSLNFDCDTKDHDAVSTLGFYKVNTGTARVEGTDIVPPTEGKQVTLNYTNAVEGDWYIIVLQHNHAIKIPTGYDVDNYVKVNGNNYKTPDTFKQLSLTYYRKKLTEADITEGSITLETVG